MYWSVWLKSGEYCGCGHSFFVQSILHDLRHIWLRIIINFGKIIEDIMIAIHSSTLAQDFQEKSSENLATIRMIFLPDCSFTNLRSVSRGATPKRKISFGETSRETLTMLVLLREVRSPKWARRYASRTRLCLFFFKLASCPAYFYRIWGFCKLSVRIWITGGMPVIEHFSWIERWQLFNDKHFHLKMKKRTITAMNSNSIVVDCIFELSDNLLKKMQADDFAMTTSKFWDFADRVSKVAYKLFALDNIKKHRSPTTLQHSFLKIMSVEWFILETKRVSPGEVLSPHFRTSFILKVFGQIFALIISQHPSFHTRMERYRPSVNFSPLLIITSFLLTIETSFSSSFSALTDKSFFELRIHAHTSSFLYPFLFPKRCGGLSDGNLQGWPTFSYKRSPKIEDSS